MVAQLVEPSLPTPKISGSNTDIGNFFLPIVLFNVKDKNKEKETGKGPSFFEKECFVGND